MRRRSERKKSTEVSSPALASRRTSRRRKSSEDEVKIGKAAKPSNAAENVRDSSDETLDNIRRRSSRNRTPVKDTRSPLKRSRSNRNISPGKKIKSIPEEENDNDANKTDNDEKKPIKVSGDTQKTTTKACESVLNNDNDKHDQVGVKEENFVIMAQKPVLSDKNDDDDEVELHARDNASLSRSNSPLIKQQTTTVTKEPEGGEIKQEETMIIKTEDEGVNCLGESVDKKATAEECKEAIADNHSKVEDKKTPNSSLSSSSNNKSEEVKHTQDAKTNDTSNAAADTGRTRKRRWITKKTVEGKEPVLAISTDSLKTLIADVHPVPLSDVQLESSSDVEELVNSEREEGENSPSPAPERRRESNDKLDRATKSSTRIQKNHQQNAKTIAVVPGAGVGPVTKPRSPSPARNQASNVLYITNLVRPFTVLQLKGLLARTGKIMDDGFWIDRIKSKCYVEYETEDEAIETRHALHGVRWPVSNPKCLNVDFGLKTDMLKAIETTKDDGIRFGQDANKDNLLVGSGWSRERPDIEKKSSRPVREWDVGKKENLERDKPIKEEKRSERSRGRDHSRQRECERNDRGKERRIREREREREREPRSNSLSPVLKHKKKDNDPPLRLLDDLFRKTKATPCIYWLPLTPEQISEKEAFLQKRLEEHKVRIKQRELERERERERERSRQNERDHRRNRSSDRRRSRSRDRRRY